jgi:hypothetical protein
MMQVVDTIIPLPAVKAEISIAWVMSKATKERFPSQHQERDESTRKIERPGSGKDIEDRGY